MARAALRLAAVLAVLSCAGCYDAADTLRPRIRAAGVFSPRRSVDGGGAVVRLGQLLFFDRELSGNRDTACATCHLPSQHAADDRPIALAHDRTTLLSRNTIEPFNRTFATSFFWDGRLEIVDGEIHAPVALPEGVETLLEAQALLPLLDRNEMRGRDGDVAVDGRLNELATYDDDDAEGIWQAVVERLIALPGYQAAFAEAYPRVPLEELTIVHVARAIEAFEQHLWELTDTAFDAYLGATGVPGRDEMLEGLAREGAQLFFGEAGCSSCHDGPLLSDGGYHAIGVPQIGPGRDAAGLDEGRFAVTGRPEDRFAFRTPPLRNVALTAPYMHDGAYALLEDAVRHHVEPEAALRRYSPAYAGLPVDTVTHHEQDDAIAAAIDPMLGEAAPLGEDQIFAIVMFLQTLSSNVELTVAPGAGVPELVPSGLPLDDIFVPPMPRPDEPFDPGRPGI